MKRFLVVLVVALTALVALAAPALALRDPFDPVIDLTPDTAGGVASGDGAADGANGSGDGTAGDGATSNPGVQSDAFPNTGADTTGWLAIAYVLLASGGALVIFSRMNSPSPQRAGRRVARR